MTWPQRSRRPRLDPRTGLALGGSAAIILLAALSVAPAWSMSALPVVLAASELAPATTLLALLWLFAARVLLAGKRVWRTMATVALLGAMVPGVRILVQALGLANRIALDVLPDDAAGASASTGILPSTLAGVPSAPDVRERTIEYAAADGSPLAMRLFVAPPGRAPRPIVVVLYGGGWRAGDPGQGAAQNRALAGRGYLVAAIDYRHAPEFTYPAQLDDVRQSLTMIRDSAASWNGDPSRIALLGRSAGGHLAELAAFMPGAPPVRAVIALYAPWNLADGYRDVPRPDPIGVRTVIGDFMGGAPDALPARYEEASPSSYVRPGMPPTLLLYGARDHLVKPEFNRDATSALWASNEHSVAIELPWSEHGFDLVPGGLGARIAHATIVRFLDREMKARP
jgi:acetyl esterase/lipase